MAGSGTVAVILPGAFYTLRDGKISQITAWEASLSAHMPLKALLALIKASI